MKPLYNSVTGRTKRPRKAPKRLGVMSYELRKEMSLMGDMERLQFRIAASMTLIGLGVDLLNLGR